MKFNIIILTTLSSFLFGSALAQDLEYDDMYFNGKDRAKMASLTASSKYNEPRKKLSREENEEEENFNPTDSYSARSVNPEYTSRSQSQTAKEDDEDYFVNDYKYNTQNRLNNWYNGYNSWYNNPWYNSAYWAPSISAFNSPYYGYGYDAWGSPWGYSPYGRSGWSTSFGFYSGGMMGWGMNYGWGNYWADPWNMWGPAYGSYWRSPYYGWYNYPTRVIVVENGRNRGPVYMKRGSRSTNRDQYVNSSGTRPYTNPVSGSRSADGGRVNSNSPKQPEYYNRNWRNNANQNSSSGYSNNNNSTNTGRTNSSWGDNSGSRTWRQSSPSQNSSPSYSSPSRSSSSSFGSGNSSGSRSSGSSSGSSGSRSSRGRGN